MAVNARLASAVMLLRDGAAGLEVFMVRRVVQSDFMPNVYVFPGGSVSEDDRSVERIGGICQLVLPSLADPENRTALGSGVRAGAIRELFEEAGVLLAYHQGQMLALTPENLERFTRYRDAFNRRNGSLVDLATEEDLTLATDKLRYFSHWVTPEGMPKRFDTHFFLATAPVEQEAAHDQLETSDGVWVNPGQALTRFDHGRFPLVFATIYQLRELAQFLNVEQALTYAEKHPVMSRLPVMVEENGTARVHLPENPTGNWDVPDYMTRPR